MDKILVTGGAGFLGSHLCEHLVKAGGDVLCVENLFTNRWTWLAANARKLFAKEIGVSALNGLIWGSVVGLFAFLIYHNWQLGVVMTGAMVLSLMLAAVMGVTVPLLLQKLGRDPALGSSVLITAITDSGGFFIFLGLATVFLV